MRLLQRARPNLDAVIFVETAFVLELGFAPSLEDHGEIFFETIAQIVEGNTEGERFPFDKAVADAEFYPPAAQTIQGGVVFGTRSGL